MNLAQNSRHVKRSLVGVVGAMISLVKVNLSGQEQTVLQKSLNGRPECQESVNSGSPLIGHKQHDCKGSINIPSLNLKDGENLCADMQVSSGGFYELQDDHMASQGTRYFTPVTKTKRVCFTYDITVPVHCSQSPSSRPCNSQPLQLSTRLTRKPEVRVHVKGWLDPIPPGGTSKAASKINKYRLEVHGVDENRTMLSVQENARRNYTLEWQVNIAARGGPYNVNVRLPEEGAPRLYAIILEVHDNAGNVGYARRLVLYDNTSTVELKPSASLRVVSANPKSNLRWQTDVARNICVDWKDRFYNNELYHFNFLMPVKTDSGRNILGDYDQRTGLLPVTGTHNVYGVIQFEVAWSRDGSPRSAKQKVTAQTTCFREPLNDGETYQVWIRAKDIMSNFRDDSVTVSIDHTGPSVSIEGLRGRFGRDGLYVHNTTDLSTMVLLVHAADPHSGIKTLEWTVGTRDLADDVGRGALGVNRLGNETDCSKRKHCYCPSVGECETQQYLFTFSNLVKNNNHQGQHHREYYITITATNHASLRFRQMMDILIDESPPTVGVVLEGLSDDNQAEMDFTHDDGVHVRWHGFLDHESGILLYRVVLAERCLTNEEMDASHSATVVEGGTATTLNFPGEGQFFTNVAAYNGAMQPSGVACSDGIVHDKSPPRLLNVSAIHARAGPSVSCSKPDQPWLVNANLTRVRLAKTNGCLSLCPANVSRVSTEHLPLSSNHTLDVEVSDDLCRRLPMTTGDDYILLPSDYVKLSWAGEDEESEMEEYYVGMGTDRTTASAPDLLPFTPTHGHHSYHARHSGLGHGAVFFIFLRALSKAGLDVQLTLGPVIIDVTPPDVTQPLTAHVEGDYLVTRWTEDVFKDSEQPAGVDFEVTFRVGYTDSFVTPFLSMPESALAQCWKKNFTGCAHYPISALHPHDTEQGRYFFFQLHNANAAGHVTTVNTSSVRLPAHYPPSHAVIVDVLKTGPRASSSSPFAQTTTASVLSTSPLASANETETTPDDPTEDTSTQPTPFKMYEFSKDVDVILQRDEVCVAWSGFYHKEEVTVEVGLGTAPQQDDIVPFSQTENKSPVCFNATSFPVYTKIFSVIRASSSGGTTVLFSDGFRMIPRYDANNKLLVFNGQGCASSDVIGSQSITPFASTDLNLTTDIPLHPGDVVFVRFTPSIEHVTFPDSLLLRATLEGYQVLVKTASVTAVLPTAVASNTTVEILNCLVDPPLQPVPKDRVSVTWEMAGPWTSAAKYLKIEVIDEDCMHIGQKKDKYRRLQCRLDEKRLHPSQRKLDIHGKTVLPGRSYTASVSVCFDDECLPAVTSAPVKYEEVKRSVIFHEATIESQSKKNIEGRFTATIYPLVNISSSRTTLPCAFRWTITRDSPSTPLASWRFGESRSCSDIQVKDSVDYNGASQGTLYVCIHPVFPWKDEKSTCKRLSRPGNLNQVDPYHVIELSHTTFRETDFEEYLHSGQLGSKLHKLYDFDLDFATSDVILSAILTNGEGREVTWFLSTNPRVPADGNCAGDTTCVTSKTTNDGKVVFPRVDSKLEDGLVYFICASVSASDQQSEEACGDGVVIDDSPPIEGSVTISNADSGYLPDGDRLLVTWQGFSDIEKVSSAPLPNDITISYFVALGSYPGGEDIAHFVPVGQRTTWTFEHLNAAPGVNCIATVRAEDRVGHMTEVWSRSVIIDSTPPVVGYVAAGTVTRERFVPGPELSIHWEGVEDMESGVETLEVAVVSEEGQEEVVPFERYQGNSAVLPQTPGLVDGHSYVVLLQVTNKAGLSTLAQSQPFIIDSSPPGPGTVWNTAPNETDHRAYSTEVGVYRMYWTGFSEPHSGLDFYRVGLGSQPQQTDVHPFIYVGLQTSYIWKHEFAQGKRYYGTVAACNKAGLCRMTSSSSLIFDDSPPTAGHVVVGFDGHHSRYLGHNSSLPVQWTGFSDPQTGISEFWWCVGTSHGHCDVAPSVHTLLSQATVRSGLSLPVATPLYVTVRARNPAGHDTVSISDSFVVDITPPEVITSPEFLSPRDGGPISGQHDRSVLRLAWQFRDPDSSVVSQTVSIRSQLTGRLVADPVIVTTDSEMILPLEDDKLLLDGDRYWAVVTACNAAGLCTTANSSLLLIDSTPPVKGTFESPLVWAKKTGNPVTPGSPVTQVNLTWRGFADAESGVAKYRLSAGRSYNGEELSNGQMDVVHNNNTRSQAFTLNITQKIEMGDVIHFSMFAENGLGHRSPIARMEFEVFFDDASGTIGSLISLRHSCEASYCTGECTCAADQRLCQTNWSSCSELHSSHPTIQDLQISAYIGSQSKQQDITTSVKCLEGHWWLLDPALLFNISRFEWSISLANMTAGEGVFFVQNETVWHDVGRNMAAVHCLPGRRVLNSGQKYILHVRAWLSSKDHVTFTSSSVIIDHSPPQVKRGGAVIESDVTCGKDIDYVTTEPQITACWDGVFRDSQSQVIGYEVWIGTSPYAEDFVKRTDVGSSTSWTFPTANLERGIRYYVTVRATNGAGLVTSATSDGVIVDISPPVSGVVFTAYGYTNRHAQTSTTTMQSSWHGFQDRHSGVKAYHVALYDVTGGTTPLVSFHDIGFYTTYTFEGVVLQDKHSYQVMVRAVDAAGLKSSPAASRPILVDATGPEGIMCSQYHLVARTSMIHTETPTFLRDVYFAEFFVEKSPQDELINIVIDASGLEPESEGYIMVRELKMPVYFKFAQTGNATAHHVFVLEATENVTLTVSVAANPRARLSAKYYRCSNTIRSEQEAVTIHQMSQYDVSVCARIRDEESGIRSMVVGVGTSSGGLQVHPLTPVGHSGHTLVKVHVQHGLPLYATVHVENHAGQWSRFISHPIIMDRTPPELTQVRVLLRHEGEGQINGSQVWADAEWMAMDKESSVVSCTCDLEGETTDGEYFKTATGLDPGRCQWRLREPQHGAGVRVRVSCVNGVQIHQTVTSDVATVLLHSPTMKEATFISLSNNAMMSPFERFDSTVRSANSSLEFCLHGAYDPTITELQYRFLHESRPLGGWSSLNIHKTSAMLERSDRALPSGSVTAQVRAVNARNMTSEVVSSTVQLDDSMPILTGESASASWTNGELTLTWQHVFRLNRDATFSVYVGTAKGYGDVINHVITKKTSYTGRQETPLSDVYATITAVYANGLSDTYQAELKL